ncbi:hypothetical protein Plhal710r2_c003g0015341 [Plasmopara halstedii]
MTNLRSQFCSRLEFAKLKATTTLASVLTPVDENSSVNHKLFAAASIQEYCRTMPGPTIGLKARCTAQLCR